jgi:diguanylate cyclase (GGDEF)-like protein
MLAFLDFLAYIALTGETGALIALSIHHLRTRQELATATQELANTTRDLATATQHAKDANYDDITGLPNRRIMLEHLHAVLAQPSPVTVTFLDLNNFKKINDTYGHQTGNEVLGEVAERLLNLNISNGIVGRLHGDEFMIITQADFRTAVSEAGRVYEALAYYRVGTTDRHLITVRPSIGVASTNDHHRTNDLQRLAEDLLRRADAYMYKAKRQGGGVEPLHPDTPHPTINPQPHPHNERRTYRRL